MTLKRLPNGEIYFGEAKWTAQSTIECLVELEETGEVLPFNATSYDEEAHGRELYEMLSTKYLDQVAPCSDSERFEAFAGDVKSERNARLRNTDWIANGDVRLENQVKWLQYRQDLRDITSQPNYPYDVTWPTEPTLTRSVPVNTRITTAVAAASES